MVNMIKFPYNVRCVARLIDAHGFRRHFIIPDGLEGPAVGGMNQQHDHRDAKNRQQEGHEGA